MTRLALLLASVVYACAAAWAFLAMTGGFWLYLSDAEFTYALEASLSCLYAVSSAIVAGWAYWMATK